MRGLRPEGTRAGLIGPRSAIAMALGLGLLLLLACFGPARAPAEVACPNSNPVINENQCKTGTNAWRGTEEDSPNLGGFTTQTSVNLGESVTLKIGRNGPVSPTKTATIETFRMGYYEGLGGRLVNSATKVAINNDFTCEKMDEVTGKVSCANWAPTYTIPGSAFPASGVYLAKVSASTGEQTQVVFTVRDDKRTTKAKILYVLPIATYEAYNTFGGKSLYFGTEGGKFLLKPRDEVRNPPHIAASWAGTVGGKNYHVTSGQNATFYVEEHDTGRGQHSAAAHGEPDHPGEPPGRGRLTADDLVDPGYVGGAAAHADRLGPVSGPGRRPAAGKNDGEQPEQDR